MKLMVFGAIATLFALSLTTVFADYTTAPVASDVRFVVKTGDVTSGNMGSTQRQNITFSIPIDRYFGDKELLLANGGLPQTVTLNMIVWDVDESAGEVDEVSINGQCFPGNKFTGAHESWKLNSFQIPISMINLPSAPGQRALNTVSIDISVGDPGWVTRVDWAALYIPAPPPVIISHGIRDNAAGMADLKNAVEVLGLPVEVFSYREHGENSIGSGAKELAACVTKAKSKYNVDKVQILCHSMGGLKARHYTTEIDKNAESVDRVIQIATPNCGSRLVYVIFGEFMDLNSPAYFQLTPLYMRRYNSKHPLNNRVKYVVLAGDNGNVWYSPKESNYFAPGDGIVSVASAHTMVPAHMDSPVNDRRATHGGLVTSGSNGMVDTVIGSILKQDLLGRKHADGTRYDYGVGTFNLEPAFAVEDELEETVAVQTGIVNLGSATFSFPFQIVTENGGPALVSFVAEKDVEITSVHSPSGVVYASTDEGIEISSYAGMTSIRIASTEAGIWTASATRASGIEALPYAVSVDEADSNISISGSFDTDALPVGSRFSLELALKDNGATKTGASCTLSVAAPDGSTPSVAMTNNGGLHTASFYASQPGVYIATARMAIGGVEYIRTFSCTALASSAKIASLSADGPVDDDGDGHYDRLSVSGTLSATETSASYRIFGLLADQDGSNFVWTAATVANGETSFRLDFDGDAIYRHRQSAQYTVSTLRLFELGDDYEAEVDSRNSEIVFSAMPWSHADFTHSFVEVTGTGNDMVVSTSTTNAVSALRVGLDIKYDSSISGTYEYSISLKTAFGMHLATSHGSVELPVGTGIATTRLQFDFDGEEIAASGIDGPYVVSDILMWNAQHEFIPIGGYGTRAWLATDFVDSGLWYVDAEKGDDANFGSTWDIPKKSIQAAIDMASSGDAILVNDGRYEPIAVKDKTLAITSVNGADKTFIDGALQWSRGATNRCALLGNSSSDCATRLSGFHLKNGIANGSGGGSYGGMLYNCILSGNRASQDGGGSYGSTLYNCTVRDNVAEANGGGVTSSTLFNCSLFDNIATDTCVKPAASFIHYIFGTYAGCGGGSYLSTLRNCLIFGNISENYGGALYCGHADNCTIINNRSNKYPGSEFSGEITVKNAPVPMSLNTYTPPIPYTNQCVVVNSIVFSDAAATSAETEAVVLMSCCVNNPVAGDGNIVADPCFVDFAAGDFRLRWDSPCIDAGDNDFVATEMDLDGRNRVFGGRVDIGAYEYVLTLGDGGIPMECESGGYSGWRMAADESVPAGHVVRSGAMPSGTNSWMETIVEGPGVLSFDWRVSCNTRGHYAQFLIDGVQQGRILGITDWENMRIAIEDGTHTLRWIYVKGSTSATGEDLVEVANLAWRPNVSLAITSSFGSVTPGTGTWTMSYGDIVTSFCPAVIDEGRTRRVCTGWIGTGSVPAKGSENAVSFVLEDDSSIKWQWRTEYWIDVQISGDVTTDFESGWVADGSLIDIPWTALTDCYRSFELDGDTSDVKVAYESGGGVLTFPVDGPRSLSLVASCITLGESLNMPKLVWETGADAPWFPQDVFVADHEAAAVSSPVLGDDISWLSTTVSGPGTASWVWYLYEGGSSGIDVFIDGEYHGGLYTPFVSQETAIDIDGEGDHEIRLEFWNAGTEENFYDLVVIDCFNWTGRYPDGTVTDQGIPYNWIDDHPTLLDIAGGDHEAVAFLPAANGENTVWECYVADLDPLDPASVFRIHIEFIDGNPVVTFDPYLGPDRDYYIDGKMTLSPEEEWIDVTDVSDLGATGCRFFRGRVKLPVIPMMPETVSAALSGKTVVVSWSPVPQATSYEVLREDAGGSAVLVGTCSDPSFTDVTAVPGCSCRYLVRGVLKGRSGPAGASGEVMLPLSAPSGLVATQGTTVDGIDLSWNAVEGVIKYEILRCAGYNTDAAVVIGETDGATTFYKDSNTVPGATAYYWIRAIASSCSAQSDSVSGWRGLQKPSGVASSKHETDWVSKVWSLYWSPVSGAASYRVYYGTGSFSSAGLLKQTTDTSCSSGYLDKKQNWHFWIQAVCPNGVSEPGECRNVFF